MKRFLFALPLLAAVAACQNASVGVQNDVLAAEQGLTVAERAALIYTGLPRCGSAGAGAICSDAATVQRIKDLDNQAYAAVQAARQNEAMVSAALVAISSLESAVPKAAAVR